MAPTMKSQRHEKLSTINPASTRPKPPPTPKTAESNPTPTFIFAGGNSSRMIPKLRGNTAAPAPEAPRKPISAQMFQASAHPTVPRKNSMRLTTRIRSLPNRSPSLPRMGVNTAAVSRKPVNTHVTHVVVASSSVCRTGSAGTTIVCWSAYAVPASVRIPSVRL